MNSIERFLLYLAEQKHHMYHNLYIHNSVACQEEECVNRIKTIHKYETVLETIAMLPIEEQLALVEIEKEYFGDAPYTSK
ncbi:hypothetical protein [Paenibacillus pini]|uniref:Uncharacterized protein n=1 Tax=Paenibacillus pini JCM 16418 TaxID=1236976 RepID=W7YJ02_9BACL|nr:hypothetical protein [Paenibacillus pini]GAF10885.1 hypothetical protein JCM16418_5116 [Paenibacillus pini JCM 16418]